MVIVLAAALALQTPAAQPVKPEDPGAMAPQTAWSGCLQAGSTPSTYRLNLDAGSAVAGPGDPVSLGDPFVQLVGNLAKLGVADHVGKHVTVKGNIVARRSRASRRAQARSAGGQRDGRRDGRPVRSASALRARADDRRLRGGVQVV